MEYLFTHFRSRERTPTLFPSWNISWDYLVFFKLIESDQPSLFLLFCQKSAPRVEKKRRIMPDSCSLPSVCVCVCDSTQGCAVPRGPVTTVCVPAEPSPPLPSQLLFLPCSYVSRSWRAGDRGRVRSWDGESIPSGHTHTLACTCNHTNKHTHIPKQNIYSKESEYVTYANIHSKTESDALLAVSWWHYTYGGTP